MFRWLVLNEIQQIIFFFSRIFNFWMEQMERCVLLSTKLYLPQKVISDLLTYFVHHRYFAEHLLFFIQSTCFNRSCCLFDCRWYYKTNKENSCINKRTVFLFLFFPYHFLTLPLPLLPYLTPFSTLSPSLGNFPTSCK